MSRDRGCEYWTGDRCRLGKYEGRPSAGVCKACQSAGENHVEGVGDLVKLAIDPIASRLAPLT